MSFGDGLRISKAYSLAGRCGCPGGGAAIGVTACFSDGDDDDDEGTFDSPAKTGFDSNPDSGTGPLDDIECGLAMGIE